MKRINFTLIIAMVTSCFAFAQTGITYSDTIMVNGTIREYTYYVPTIYGTANDTVPLIINMHGLGGTSASQEASEDFRGIADTANFIIVHPQGLNLPLTPTLTFTTSPGWHVLGTLSKWNTDRIFIINLLEKIKTQYDIDSNRVYATGYSEGGFMSYELACFVTGRFAAIASVCGSLIPSHYSACSPGQPFPIMEIHGTNDGTIGYDGNAAFVTSTHVDSMVKYWVNYNLCNPVPTTVEKLADISDSASDDLSTVMHYVYTGGTKGATVELYKVLNGGHTVPDETPASGTPNKDFTAAKEIWRFFSQYRLDSLGVTVVTGPPTPFGTTGINNPTIENNVSLYPNPSDGMVTLYVENFEGKTVQVYDLLGTIVYAKELSSPSTAILLEDASKGIYIYKIIGNAGVVANGKLLVKP